jgi:uncharacterized protein YeaO (DUF488 family)
MIKIKRAYEPANQRDGYRVLVDRLWPRGIKKSAFSLNEWAKEIAPSTELRKSFGHDPTKWAEFSKKYQAELRSAEAKGKLEELAKRARRSNLTLVYSARDELHNDAVVLKKLLERKISRSAA